ncbi:hypothetical protein F4859DRAFT_60823 [Xylaria cf. heliscus]|nr:hypothetical protein F4859DRAFT_60823 [Xylaria cf. heliscus]
MYLSIYLSIYLCTCPLHRDTRLHIYIYLLKPDRSPRPKSRSQTQTDTPARTETSIHTYIDTYNLPRNHLATTTPKAIQTTSTSKTPRPPSPPPNAQNDTNIHPRHHNRHHNHLHRLHIPRPLPNPALPRIQSAVLLRRVSPPANNRSAVSIVPSHRCSQWHHRNSGSHSDRRRQCDGPRCGHYRESPGELSLDHSSGIHE